MPLDSGTVRGRWLGRWLPARPRGTSRRSAGERNPGDRARRASLSRCACPECAARRSACPARSVAAVRARAGRGRADTVARRVTDQAGRSGGCRRREPMPGQPRRTARRALTARPGCASRFGRGRAPRSRRPEAGPRLGRDRGTVHPLGRPARQRPPRDACKRCGAAGVIDSAPQVGPRGGEVRGNGWRGAHRGHVHTPLLPVQ